MSAEHHPCCSAWPSASSSVRLKAGPSFVHRFARPGQPVVRTACRGPWSRDATKDHSGQGERDLQWADPPTLDLLQYEHAPTVDKDLGRGPRLLAAPPIGEPSAEPPVAVAVLRGQSTIVRGSGRGGPFDQAHVREYGEGATNLQRAAGHLARYGLPVGHHADARRAVRTPRVERRSPPFDLTPDPGIRVTMRGGEAIVRVTVKRTGPMFPDEEPFRRPQSWLLAEASERLRDEDRRASIAEARQGVLYEAAGARGGRASARRVAG